VHGSDTSDRYGQARPTPSGLGRNYRARDPKKQPGSARNSNS
jgi:hypothetical protein